MSKYPRLLLPCTFLLSCGCVALSADRPQVPVRPRTVASRPAAEAAGRQASPRERRRLSPPQPTRIRLDVFRITMPYENGVDFSLDSLRPHAANSKTLLGALAKQGKATLAYRFDETIDLAEESMLAHGKQQPVIKSASISREGTVIPMVDYVDAVCKIKILGLWSHDKGSPEQADVSFVFESKNVDTSSLKIGGGIQAPIIATFESERSLRAANGQPILSACFDLQRAQSEDDKEETQQFGVCIIRLQLDRLAAAEQR